MKSHTTTFIAAGRFAMLLAVSAIGLAASSAQATEQASARNPAPLSLRVNFADLDLSTETGNKALYQRIRAAAAQVCPLIRTTGSSIPKRDHGCIDDAIAQAVNSIKSPLLVKLQAGHVSGS